MVYRGKPSTGCLNCRSRHIKCDETRPHCRACVRTGRTCPGYRHPLDVMLRQRTAFERKKRTAPASEVQSPVVDGKNAMVAMATSVSDQSDMFVSPTSSNTVFPKYPLPSEVRPASIPSTVYSPMEDTVTSLFFNSYLYLPKDPLIRIGFMELLPQTYSNTKQGSHLHLSALAVSFFSVAAWTGNPSLYRSSEQFFAKAISKTRLALQDNIDGRLDEILMTVLLLSTYEEFSAVKDHRVPTKAHLHGAIALINSRKKQEEDTQYSGTLSNSVQVQIIKTSMGLTNSMVQTPNVWPLTPPIPQSLSSQLTSASSALVNLRREYAAAVSQPGVYDPADITNILARASNLDVHLSVWEHTLPEYWKPMSASLIPQSVRDAGIYRNRCDCYPDLWIAGTWNFYRESRVVIQKVILSCLRLLPDRDDALEQIQATLARIRGIATDICATVPFFLGSQMDSVKLGPAHIQYPEAEGRRVSQAHRQAAPLLGGWIVFFHLNNLCSPEFCLPEEQIAWIGEQKRRIFRIYNMDVTKRLGV